MKLIAEPNSKNTPEAWRIFIEDEYGKHRVDLSLNSTKIMRLGKAGKVEFSIIRPAGLINRVFGERRRIYMQIRRKSPGEKTATGWLLSDDQGHSWSMTKKPRTKTTEVLDTLTLDV